MQLQLQSQLFSVVGVGVGVGVVPGFFFVGSEGVLVYAVAQKIGRTQSQLR